MAGPPKPPSGSPTGSASPSKPPSPRRAAWDEDVALVETSVKLLFTNRIQEAEAIAKRGTEAPRRTLPPGVDSRRPPRDIRSAYALQWTLVALLQGVASLANDQLEECLRRVSMARQLAGEAEDWAGQRVVMGVSLLLTGVVQVLQNAFVQASVNFVRAWSYIGRFDEALAFDGYEAKPVRSFALFTLGIFNLVISMLPPMILRVATFAGGPAIKGDQDEALQHLSRCQEEGGQLAPWAATVLLLFHLNFKCMMGEGHLNPQTSDEAYCDRLLEWAEERYPKSGIFMFFRCDLLAMQRRLPEAQECLEEISVMVKPLQLPALELMVHFKKGLLGVSKLQWEYARTGFQCSMQLYTKAGRRSWVPLLAYLSALCAALEGEPIQWEAMLGVMKKYRQMKKKNWPQEDALAFRKMKEYESLPLAMSHIAFLDLLECIIIMFNSAPWMEVESSEAVLSRLQTLEQDAMSRRASWPADEQIRIHMARSEFLRLLKRRDEAKREAEVGLELEPQLQPRGIANASVMQLRWTLASLAASSADLANAKEQLKKSEKIPRPCGAYDMAFQFRKHTLRKALESRGRDGASGFQQAGQAASPTDKDLEPPPLDEMLDGVPSEGFHSADEGDDLTEVPCDSSNPRFDASPSDAGFARGVSGSNSRRFEEYWDGYRLEIAVHGMEQVEGHSWYVLACAVQGSDCGSTWCVRKRLSQLRDSLHDPVRALLGATAYTEFFANAPFARRGAPPGTVARLRDWCAMLARCVTRQQAPPELPLVVLRFLDAPAEAFVAVQTAGGSLRTLKGKEDVDVFEDAVERAG